MATKNNPKAAVTKSQIRCVQTVAKDHGVTMDDSEAEKHASIIIENTHDYYATGERSEKTKDDDFYYDVKEYFNN